MKKTKLLTSLAALALVLGLGACSETEDDTTLEDEGSATTTETESGDGETSGSGNDGDGEGETEEAFTTTSSSVDDAIALVEENGAAVTSWTGIDGRWDYVLDVYQDLSYEGGEGYAHDDYYSYSEVYLTQAVLTDDGFTGLWDITDTYSFGDFTFAIFIDGDDLYENLYGYVEFDEGLGAYYTFDEFFDDLVDLLEGDESVLITFEELADEEGITLTGEVAVSDRGNTRSSLALSGKYNVSLYDYYFAEETVELGLDVVYDADGGLASFTYSCNCLDVWDDGEIDIEEQTITYVPFEGEVATPDWVLSYSA